MSDLCLCITLAKPVSNLTLHVFQHYFAELCTVLSREPHQMAREMFSKELITKETMRKVVKMRDPFLDKAGVLVDAIQDRIAEEGNSRPLKAFCELLNRHPEVGRIATRMKARLGELVSWFLVFVGKKVLTMLAWLP